VLVEKEDEAKQVIADLQKGQKFEDLAKQRSKTRGPRTAAATSTGTPRPTS